MPDNDLIQFDSGLGVPKFSKTPLIRKFKSLLSDEEFESAGLKIARHPLSDTCLIIPATEHLLEKEDDRSNKLLGKRYVFLHSSFNAAQTNQLSSTESSSSNLDPALERIDELRALAAEEGLPFSELSATEASDWLRAATPPSMPSAFLLNNGNIRFLWRRGEAQVGLQFLGNGTTQFVFLGEDDQTERIFGSLKTSELLKRFNGLDLLGILGF